MKTRKDLNKKLDKRIETNGAEKENKKIEENKVNLFETHSIEMFEKKTTLFYSLKTGDIKLTCGGIQTMDFLGEDKFDYNYGVLVIDNDDFVLNNLQNFRVVEGELELKDNKFISKYLKSK